MKKRIERIEIFYASAGSPTILTGNLKASIIKSCNPALLRIQKFLTNEEYIIPLSSNTKLVKIIKEDISDKILN